MAVTVEGTHVCSDDDDDVVCVCVSRDELVYPFSERLGSLLPSCGPFWPVGHSRRFFRLSVLLGRMS